jgi:glycosyltransferase involved in cell wall biosynthesis
MPRGAFCSEAPMFSPCAVIPVYNHEHAVGEVVAGVLRHKLPCVVVDDGSSPTCAAALDELAAAAPTRLTLLRHPVNRGKGAAVLTAVRHAERSGYSHALQIDADGQHRVDDIPRFLERAEARPHALIIGCPEYDASVPPLRLWARYLTHMWVSINTLSRQIKDSMCGFRVYPLSSLMEVDRRYRLGERMHFDIEVAVRLYWNGVKIINVPTPVTYPRNGVSHFRPWADTARISRMHALLFFGMLRRSPALVARHWSTL